ARNRVGRTGPAVREPRRAHQGRHAFRRVHHPGLARRVAVPEDRASATPGEGPRHEARERALALLYEAEMKRVALPEVLQALTVAPDPFTAALVEGVGARAEHIDAL